MTIKITAMAKTVEHVNTRRAWTQWTRHTKKPVQSAHEAMENSSAQEIKEMMMGMSKMMLQQQEQVQKQMEMQYGGLAACHGVRQHPGTST